MCQDLEPEAELDVLQKGVRDWVKSRPGQWGGAGIEGPQLVLKKNFKARQHIIVMLESDKPESESSSATSQLAERS